MENMHSEGVIIKILRKILKKILKGPKFWKWRHDIFFPFVLDNIYNVWFVLTVF